MTKSSSSSPSSPSCCDSSKQQQQHQYDISCTSSANPAPNKSFYFFARLSALSPILSAILHSSCCWLPVLLDLTSIGSASASASASLSALHWLKPFFLATTILVLAESVRRQGLTNRRTVLRIVTTCLILALPRILPYLVDLVRPPTGAKESSHSASCH